MLFLESFVSRFPLDDPLRHMMEKRLPGGARRRANEIRAQEYDRIAASLMSHVDSSARTKYSSRQESP